MKRYLESHLVMLSLVSVLAAGYLGTHFDQGWIPHDEGLLAMTAERVLAGELPHRDFSDTYTGGLAFLHAFAFRLLGVHLLAPRVTLLVFSLLFVAAFYRLATRFAPAPLAALFTLTAFVWSVPNYFAGLPSWYNLFFSVFGALALTKYLESSQRRWIFAAGLCGGISFLFKLHGLSYVAAALLVLVYREQVTARTEEGRNRIYSIFTVTCLVLFVLSLVGAIARRMASADFFYFVLPGFVLALVLARGELRRDTGGRWRQLFEPGAVFFAGLIIPIGIFLLPYVVRGGLDAFYNGVFVSPGSRFEFATYAPPPLFTVAAALPVAALFVLRSRKVETVLLVPAVLLLGLAVYFGGRPQVYLPVWFSARPLVPLATLVGGILLARAEGLSPLRRQQIFLALAMSAMVSLVQFPYAHGIYFCYAAPWAVLALTFLASEQPRAPKRLFLCFLVFYAAFAVVWLNRGFERHLGSRFTNMVQETDLGLERSGLRVSLPMAFFYQRLTDIVRQHSEEGSYIYAAPDCPEVYFLSGRKNPTRTVYDFLDEDFRVDPEGRTRRILGLLEEHDVEVVVLNWRSEFSGGIQPDLAEALKARYPQSVSLSPFTVHWREADTP